MSRIAHNANQYTSSSEPLFFELAFDNLRRTADLFRSIYDQTNGIDG